MKIRVGVFFGGRSVEHGVSVISAQQVMAAIDRERYNVVPVYITKDGRFYTGDALIGTALFRDIPALLKRCQRIEPVVATGERRWVFYPVSRWKKEKSVTMDVAIPVTHGTFGEDGCLQGLFEMMGLPYAGCDVTASALGMDKPVAKTLWVAKGLPVVDGIEVSADEWFAGPDTIAGRVEQTCGWPAVIKPACLGSSVGLNTASDPTSFHAAMRDTSMYASRILVEKMITPLREINCSVLGDTRSCEASVCEEPLRASEVLSFRDKYESGGKGTKGTSGSSQGMSGLKRRLPAELPGDLATRVQQAAVNAYRALGAFGVARVDFLYHEPSGAFYVNEINTIPGSLSFYLWEASGVPFPSLMERLIAGSLSRHRERARLTRSFDTNILAGLAAGAKTGSKS